MAAYSSRLPMARKTAVVVEQQASQMRVERCMPSLCTSVKTSGLPEKLSIEYYVFWYAAERKPS
jgi:hypothetical protein